MYIISKYLGPTNHRGSRYKATVDYGYGGDKQSVTVSYNYELDPAGNAAEAVKALIRKYDMNEYGAWDSFYLADGSQGYMAISTKRGGVFSLEELSLES